MNEPKWDNRVKSGLARPKALVASAVALFVVGLATGSGTAWVRHDSSQSAKQGPLLSPTPDAHPPTKSSTGTSSVPPSPVPTPRSSPTPNAPSAAQREREALARLENLAANDLRRTTFTGEWVAQLSSKYVGVKDLRQRTASGSHTFGAVAILAEHQALRDRFDGRYQVRLLRGQDWGARTTRPDGATFWFTLVIGDFHSRADVEAFCRRAFRGLSAQDLENQCLPRTLRR